MLELTDSNFNQEVLKSDVPVLVDFWAAWCMPCKNIAPIIEELSKEYDGKMKFGKLNVENSQSVSRQYGIRSIPTLLIFKDGEVATQIVGMQPKRKLQEKILEII